MGERAKKDEARLEPMLAPAGRRGRARPPRAGGAAPGDAVAGWLAEAGLAATLRRLRAALLHRMAADWAREVTSGRLILWLPVLFTVGILFYFGAPREPSLPAVGGVLLGGGLCAMLVRRRQGVFCAVVAFLALASGFGAATLRTAMLDRPWFTAPAGPVTILGYVEKVERRARTDRMVLYVTGMEGRGARRPPARVRLSVRAGTAPQVGAYVSQLAQLMPPLGAALPGAHDFGRQPWFRGIDAIGFGLGRPRVLENEGARPFAVRFAAMVDELRALLSGRIRASLEGTPAAIAVALVAGDRASIPESVEEGMRVSGLTHILSISGLHMALVAGTLFAIARALMAAVPALALGAPVKSIAAGVALLGSAFYLLLSGNDVPAQRSFVMAALVLAGVLFGRPALTLRTVAVAAVVVLFLAPEAVLEPGTQMSFAATFALVAAYEHLRPLRAVPLPEGNTLRLATKLALFFGGSALTSIVAGLATAPYAAFHFQRLAPYGLIANLAAAPAVSILVMPAGLIGVLLMPFGWDAVAWPVMGFGIEIMMAVSDHVAALPGADGRFHMVGGTSLACASLALACLCLLRGSLAFVAVVPLAAAVLTLAPPPRADILIAPDGESVAVRGPDGRLAIAGGKANRLIAQQWLEREGDHRPLAEAEGAPFICDKLGCAAPLPDGGRLALSRKAASLEADCLESQIVVTRDMAPGACPARVIDPAAMVDAGTLALFWTGDGWRTVPTRNPATERPWMPPLTRPAKAAGADVGVPAEADLQADAAAAEP